MQIEGCGEGSRRQPFGQDVTLGAPPTQSPRELPSLEHTGVVSPVNSPQPPASPPPPEPELLPLEEPLLPPELLPPSEVDPPPELPPLPEPAVPELLPPPELLPEAAPSDPPSAPGPTPDPVPGVEEEQPTTMATETSGVQGRSIADRAARTAPCATAAAAPPNPRAFTNLLGLRSRALARSRPTARAYPRIALSGEVRAARMAGKKPPSSPIPPANTSAVMSTRASARTRRRSPTSSRSSSSRSARSPSPATPRAPTAPPTTPRSTASSRNDTEDARAARSRARAACRSRAAGSRRPRTS